MLRRLRLPVLLALVLLLVAWLGKRGDWFSAQPKVPQSNILSPLAIAPSPAIGDVILAEYGKPSTTIQQDLQAMQQLLINFRTLVKHPDALPLGANLEIAAALRGQGRHNREVFLNHRLSLFNTAGELLDRWGTPLFFHAEARDKISVRTAGPDRELWTDDDVILGWDAIFKGGR
jgi:hypothetical protein